MDKICHTEVSHVQSSNLNGQSTNSMKMYPIKARLDEPVLESIKAGSFVHQGIKLQRQYQADLPTKTIL